MKINICAAIAIALECFLPASAQTDVQLCEPWKSEYAGDDAAGTHVIGLWHFNTGQETKDASGNGHDAKLLGVGINANGRFGAALESLSNDSGEKK